jgi:hypothetical protein
MQEKGKRVVVLGTGSDVEYICQVLSKLNETNPSEFQEKIESVFISTGDMNLSPFDIFIIGESVSDKINLEKYISSKKMIFIVRTIPNIIDTDLVNVIISNYSSKSCTMQSISNILRKIA